MDTPATAPAPSDGVTAADLLKAADDLRTRAAAMLAATVVAPSLAPVPPPSPALAPVAQAPLGEPANKPGVKTTEFAVTVGALALGAYLLIAGINQELGGSLITWATGGYVLSRAITKSGVVQNLKK